MAGTDKSNPWQKYHNHPRHPMFGGCLFLGGFKNLSKNEDKIKKTIKGKIADIKDEANPDVVKLHDPPRYFPDPSDKHWWLLGLLLRTDWPRV